MPRWSELDARRLPSPCFVVDEVAVEENLKVLNKVQEASGAKVLAALKKRAFEHKDKLAALLQPVIADRARCIEALLDVT